jgi:hypothetical protein
MKKHTTYYIIGAVLVGTGIYLYSTKNKNKSVVNLNPPMEVTEEDGGFIKTTETTVFTALDKLKALIDSIKSKGVATPPITN